jgi:hypothetical protein
MLAKFLFLSFLNLVLSQTTCSNPTCPDGFILSENNNCINTMPTGTYAICMQNEFYNDSQRLCIDSYETDATIPCKEGYSLVVENNKNLCTKSHPPYFSKCPEKYFEKINLDGNSICIRNVSATCDSTFNNTNTCPPDFPNCNNYSNSNGTIICPADNPECMNYSNFSSDSASFTPKPSISSKPTQENNTNISSITPTVSQYPVYSPISTNNCTNFYCDYPSVLVNNRYCLWNLTDLNISCNDGDQYNINNNKCYHGYQKTSSMDCESGMSIYEFEGTLYCAYVYDPITSCPTGFINWYIQENNRKACAKVSIPRCIDYTSPSITNKPIEPSLSSSSSSSASASASASASIQIKMEASYSPTPRENIFSTTTATTTNKPVEVTVSPRSDINITTSSVSGTNTATTTRKPIEPSVSPISNTDTDITTSSATTTRKPIEPSVSPISNTDTNMTTSSTTVTNTATTTRKPIEPSVSPISDTDTNMTTFSVTVTNTATTTRKPVEASISPVIDEPSSSVSNKPIEQSSSKTPYPTRRPTISSTPSVYQILASRSSSITPKPSSKIETSMTSVPSVYVRPSMSAKPSNIPEICTKELDQHICVFKEIYSWGEVNTYSRIFSNLCLAKQFASIKMQNDPNLEFTCVRKCEELSLDQCENLQICKQNNNICEIRNTCNMCNQVDDITKRISCCEMRNYFSYDDNKCRYDDMRDLCYSNLDIREVSSTEMLSIIKTGTSNTNNIDMTTIGSERVTLDLSKFNSTNITNFRIERMENGEEVILEKLSLGRESNEAINTQGQIPDRQRLIVESDITVANININEGAEIIFNSGDVRIEERIIVKNNSRLTLGKGTTLSGTSTISNSIAEISGEISIPSSVNLERQQITVQEGGTMFLGDISNPEIKSNETSITILRDEAKIEINEGAEMKISSKTDVIIQSDDKSSYVLNTGIIRIDMKPTESNDKGTVELRAPFISNGLLDITSSDLKIKDEFTSTGEIQMTSTNIIVGNNDETSRRLRFLQVTSNIRFNIRGNSTGNKKSIVNINDKTKLELGKDILGDIRYTNLIVNDTSKFNMTKEATVYIEQSYIRISNDSNLTVSSATITMLNNIIDIQNKSRMEITTDSPLRSNINVDRNSILRINNTYNRMANSIRSRRLQSTSDTTLLVNGELSGKGILDYSNIKIEGDSAVLKPEGNLLIVGDLFVNKDGSIELIYSDQTISKLSIDGVASVDGLISITRTDITKPIPLDFFVATSYSFGPNAVLAVDGQVIPNALQNNQINMNLLTTNNVVENNSTNNNYLAKIGGGVGAGLFCIALIAGFIAYKQIRKNKNQKVIAKPVVELTIPIESQEATIQEPRLVSQIQNPQYQIIYTGRIGKKMMPQESTKSLFNPLHVSNGSRV